MHMRERVSDTHTSGLQAGFVASFVSKLSDTVSSEIGKVSVLPHRVWPLVACMLICVPAVSECKEWHKTAAPDQPGWSDAHVLLWREHLQAAN